MDIINNIKNLIIKYCDEYKENAQDNYDFWNEHIKYVYQESIELAKKYNADIEIVSLGALLHDIALIKKVGDRKDHHINGKEMADKILTDYNYPQSKKERVLNCVLNHRSSKNGTTIEELCVADADILAHFDNIPMLFNSGFNRNNKTLDNIREWLKNCFEKDYNDLSDKTKEIFKSSYNTILNIILGENNDK